MDLQSPLPVSSELPAAGADAGCEALTALGAVVRLRPVRQSDGDAIAELHKRTSEHNLYLRFFNASPTAGEREVTRLTRLPGEDHAVLMALLDNLLVGIASYERLSADEAEVALLVDDAHHREGIGTLLLEHLASLARRHGIARFVGETLVHNRPMLDVFRLSGMEHDRVLSSGVFDVHIDTRLDDAALAAMDERERQAELRSLHALFAPRSVAVIGAGRASGGVGHEVLRSLQRGGFTGPIYAINPRADDIEGVPAFASLAAIGQPVDLAVVAVPASAVDSVVEDCGVNGVRIAVVLSSYPPDTEDRPDEPNRASLLRTARRHGVRVVGPNCLGVVSTDPSVRLDASFTRQGPGPGGIALASQSGAVGIAALERVTASGAGVAAFISLGDKIDISGNDMLLLWDRDPRVTVIALYLESVGNSRKFARLARRVARQKPVVLLKGGRSPSGQRAGLSHTAAAATNDVMVEVLCHQAGITRVETLEELVEVATLFDDQPLPVGGRVAIVGNAGGAGVLAADAAQRAGLEVPELSPGLQAMLQSNLPMAAVTNPVDLGAAASPAAFSAALSEIARSGEVDAVVAIFGATAVGAPGRVLAVLDEAATSSPVTMLAVLFAIDDTDRHPLSSATRRLPVYGFPETAIRALAHAVRYARWRQTARGRLLEVDSDQIERARKMISGYLAELPAGGWPDAPWICALLRCYGIDVVPTTVAGSAHAATEIADRTGYPVVLKTALPGGAHKTDIGGVRTGIESANEVSAAYGSITRATGCLDVLVQPMITNACAELAMGVAVEPSFGPIVMDGLGGITTDLLNDRAFHAAPITDAEARQMVLGLRGAPLLTGYRGSQPVDLEPVLDILQRVARLAADHPAVVELDLNPVIVRAEGAVAVDVRLRLGPIPDAPDPDLRRLRA